jgi:hypothetical protein
MQQEVLGPWPVQRGVDDDMADLLRASLLSERRRYETRIDLAVDEGPDELRLGDFAVSDPLNVFARVNADVCHHRGQLYVKGISLGGNGELLASEVLDVSDVLRGKELLTSRVAAGDEDDAIACVDSLYHGRAEHKTQVDFTGVERLKVCSPELLDPTNICKALAQQERFRDVHRCVTDNCALGELQRLRFGWRLASGCVGSLSDDSRRHGERQPPYKLASVHALSLVSHENLLRTEVERLREN